MQTTLRDKVGGGSVGGGGGGDIEETPAKIQVALFCSLPMSDLIYIIFFIAEELKTISLNHNNGSMTDEVSLYNIDFQRWYQTTNSGEDLSP